MAFINDRKRLMKEKCFKHLAKDGGISEKHYLLLLLLLLLPP